MNLKLSKAYIVKTLLMLVPLVSLTIYGINAEAGFTGPVVIFSVLACAGTTFTLLWSAHKYQNTRLTEQGVEQATMGGKLFVAWAEVQRIRKYKQSFILESARGSVLVYPAAYEQAAAVNDFMVTHLQRVMNERGARVESKGGKKR